MLKRRRPSKTSWPSSGPIAPAETPSTPAALTGKGGRQRAGEAPRPVKATQTSGPAMLRVQAMIGNRAAAELVTGARHEQLFERLKLELPKKDDEQEDPAGILAKERHDDAVEYLEAYFKRLVEIGGMIGDAARRAGSSYLQASGHMPDQQSKEGLDLFITALSKIPGALPLLTLLATVTRGGGRMRRLMLHARKLGGQAEQRRPQFKTVETIDQMSPRAFAQLEPVADHLKNRLSDLRDDRHPNPKRAIQEYLDDTFGKLPDPAEAQAILDQAADEFELLQYRRFYTGRARWIKQGDERQIKGMPHAVRRRIVSLSGKPSLKAALEEWELTEEKAIEQG